MQFRQLKRRKVVEAPRRGGRRLPDRRFGAAGRSDVEGRSVVARKLAAGLAAHGVVSTSAASTELC